MAVERFDVVVVGSDTDGAGNTTTYTYDADNEQTKVTRPNSTTQVTDYNPDGKSSAASQLIAVEVSQC